MDVSALTTDLAKAGPELFQKNVNEFDFTGIKVYKAVKMPLALPKISAAGNPRPYTAADNFEDGALFTDRVLTVNQSKWDFPIDLEDFRNTYLNEFLGKADAPSGTQFIVDQVSKEYMAAINDSAMYGGTYNSSGTTAAALATGFGTIIANEITATTLTPVNTAVISASNAVTEIEKILAGMPAWMLKKNVIIYCSHAVFQRYYKHYRATYGFTFQPNPVTGKYSLDGYPNIELTPVSWMGATGRVIATLPGNLIMGTDSDRIQVYPTPYLNTIKVRLTMPLGFQIADLEALVVNDETTIA